MTYEFYFGKIQIYNLFLYLFFISYKGFLLKSFHAIISLEEFDFKYLFLFHNFVNILYFGEDLYSVNI